MTNWEECIAAPGNLFRPELNHVLRPQRTDHWFILTELLTGREHSWRNTFTQFHLSVSFTRICVAYLAHIAVRKSWDKIQKASAAQAHRVLRLPSSWGSSRPSIIGRGDDFFVRYGDKEREAVASFDFLDEFVVAATTTTAVGLSSLGSDSSPLDLDDDVPSADLNSDIMKLSPL